MEAVSQSRSAPKVDLLSVQKHYVLDIAPQLFTLQRSSCNVPKSALTSIRRSRPQPTSFRPPPLHSSSFWMYALDCDFRDKRVSGLLDPARPDRIAHLVLLVLNVPSIALLDCEECDASACCFSTIQPELSAAHSSGRCKRRNESRGVAGNRQ